MPGRQSAVIVADTGMNAYSTRAINSRISRAHTFMPAAQWSRHSCLQFNKLVDTGPTPLFRFTYKTRGDGIVFDAIDNFFQSALIAMFERLILPEWRARPLKRARSCTGTPIPKSSLMMATLPSYLHGRRASPGT